MAIQELDLSVIYSSAKKHAILSSLSLSKTFRVNRIYVCFLDLLISIGCAIILFILFRTND